MVVVSFWQFALLSQPFTELTLNLTVYRKYFGQNCMSLPTGKLLVGVYYRPPGGCCDELLHLHHALVSLWSLNFSTSSSTIAQAVCNLVQDLHLTQFVNEPTRGNHILDLVLASTPDLISNVQTVDSLPGSDHHAIQYDLTK